MLGGRGKRVLAPSFLKKFYSCHKTTENRPWTPTPLSVGLPFKQLLTVHECKKKMIMFHKGKDNYGFFHLSINWSYI